MRGWKQFLYDEDGLRYLDAVNNVAHVGHCHPRVVRAVREQSAVLNTNTRYLHERLAEYAERLTATLPDPLRVCYFVNSGSEANELAIRLARAATGRSGMVVMDAGLPREHDDAGGREPVQARWPRRIAVLRLGAEDPDAGRVSWPVPQRRSRIRATVRRGGLGRDRTRLQRHGHPVGAFLAESLLSCGGQIVLPAGFLAEAFARVRAAGGVCIADEVQVGLGRVGTHFWGFETQTVVPDIVTMGKPIGNGHPLGAVVTTPDIARAFAQRDGILQYLRRKSGRLRGRASRCST